MTETERAGKAEDVLTMWTVFNRPADFPDSFVVRPFDIVRGLLEPVPRAECYLAHSLEEARAVVARLAPGSYCLARSPGDAPTVVETWL